MLKPAFLVLCLFVAVLGGAPSPAAARILEIGQSAQPLVPSCPATPCFALSRTTGYQAKAAAERGIHTVPEDGRLVAWSITLGRTGPRQSAYFERQFGGTASAGITIIRPGHKLYARTLAGSPVQKLEPYFGSTVQFALEQSIEVKKGWIVALTVPTWAPALATGFGNDHSWRASSRRGGACKDQQTQLPQTEAGKITRYRCLFRTARLAYSATLVTAPVPSAK
ncbi:MAG: hypothetical protein H0V22_10995 [Solirubrobacterales bacterium]|jgi:hypothetical protein|nr:hypothetical protein [Solirubrobacterales bacterium]